MDLRLSYSKDPMGHLLVVEGNFNEDFAMNMLSSREYIPYTIDAVDSRRHDKKKPASVTYLLGTEQETRELIFKLRDKFSKSEHLLETIGMTFTRF